MSRILAGVYDTAMALELETDDVRNTAAISLIALIIPEARPSEIVAELARHDIPANSERLQRILQNTTVRARDVLYGKTIPPLSRNSAEAGELDWLADLILATNCMDGWGGLQVLPLPDDLKSLPEKTLAAAASWSAEVGLVFGIGLAAFAVRAIRRSKRFRTGELRSQSRTIVSLDATAKVEAGNDFATLKIVDISVGGAKAAWINPPEVDAQVSLEIGDRKLGALIVWRNDFYAGLLFDTYLTDEQVQELARVKPEASDGK